MPRHEAILEKNKNEQTDLIFIGNSIIHHWEDTGKESWEKNFAKYNPVNMGFGGDQTQHVLWRIDMGELDGINPKLAVVMIGTNNAGNGHDSEMIADGVIQIISRIRNKLPDTKILLLRIFPRGEPGSEIRQTNTTASEIFSKVANNKDIFYLDINKIFLDEEGNLPREIMPDKLHPNAKGYELWAEAIIDRVTELMK
jgi:beta-glucosidase